MMRLRLAAQVVLATLLITVLAGCSEAPGQAEETAAVETTLLEEQGVLAPGTSAEVPLELPDDVRVVQFSVAYDADLSPGSTADMSVHTPDDRDVWIPEPLRVDGTVTLPRTLLGNDPAGTWKVRLTASQNQDSDVQFTMKGHFTSGDVPAAAELVSSQVIESDQSRVVVAIVDTGINVYHESFRYDGIPVPEAVNVEHDPDGDSPPKVDSRAPLNVPLTFDGHESMADALVADDHVWRALASDTLYRFEGTRVLGISVVNPEDAPVPAYKVVMGSHGTGTAAMVLRGAPDVHLVMVQTDAATLTKAVDWVARQPWIDGVSISWGLTGNNPLGKVYPGDLADAMKAAADAGKFVVKSAGNDPTLNYSDYDGAPWCIAASGAEPAVKGRALMASNGAVDFVSDFTVNVPSDTTLNGTRGGSGTSYSAPHTAGSFANAVYHTRLGAGHTGGIQGGLLVATEDLQLDVRAVYDALARAAVYWDATEYDPDGSLSTPVVPGAPWVQTGWGYVDTDAGLAAAKHLLGEQELPEKPAEAQAYMAAQMALREAYWSV